MLFGTIIYKETVTGKSKTEAGKPLKVGTRITNEDGETKVLLNPAGKGAKYAAELKDNKHYTNEGKIKTNSNGKIKRLSDTQRAYRSGYLKARSDNSKAFNSKSGGKSNK